jgi:hypothetical protein
VTDRPDEISTGNQVYRVLWDDVSWKRCEGGERFALTRFGDNEIFINPDITETMQRDSLLHEVLHLATDHLTLDGLGKVRGFDLDEYIVRGATPWLLLILRGNPDLVAYLTA